MQFQKSLFCIWAAGLALTTLPVAADTVTLNFQARVFDVAPALTAAASVGQLLQGRYAYESNTPDAAGAPTTGLYFNAGAMPVVRLGGLAWQANQVDISLSNLPLVDIYRVDGSGTSGDTIASAGAVWRLDSVALTLTDNAAALALASDGLGLGAPNLADFNISNFTLTFVDGSNRVASIQAAVTSLTSAVPVVGTLPLVAVALGAAAAGMRRRKLRCSKPKI